MHKDTAAVSLVHYLRGSQEGRKGTGKYNRLYMKDGHSHRDITQWSMK